jgi:hypothetical protein
MNDPDEISDGLVVFNRMSQVPRVVNPIRVAPTCTDTLDITTFF